MKILIVTDLSIYAIGHSFARALTKQGHEVEVYDLQNAIDGYIKLGKLGKQINTFWPVEAWIRKGNRDLAVFFQRFKPDTVVISGNVPVTYSTLAFWKSISPATTISLFWPDTLTNLQQNQLNCASLYDQVTSYSSATLPVFNQLGFKKALWFPFAADKEYLGTVGPPGNDHFDYDLTFIGGWRPERERSVVAIMKSFPNLKIGVRGNYWIKQSKHVELKKIINPLSIYGQAFGNFIRASRINLNVIDDTNYPAANMRFFEIPAAGGLQVCSDCPEQFDVFQNKKHIYYFKNDDDLCTVVEHIISNPKEAAQVRTNAYELVCKNHTYEHRVYQFTNLPN